MDGHTGRQAIATHDWAVVVDHGHLERIRREPARFAPGGVRHLVLEVVAYAADEAEASGGGRCVITFHGDGSVSVSDEGRGTATAWDDRGHVVRKPVMSTKDLRFFGRADVPALPDGYPRQGVSVVAALSEWLVHTNHRREGSWTQRYEHGVPVTGLVPVPGAGATGTVVRFCPDAAVELGGDRPAIDRLQLAALWPTLEVEICPEPNA